MASTDNRDFPQVLKESYDPDANGIRMLLTDGVDAVVVNPDGSLNVSVSGGPVAVTGGLTDAELRASAVLTILPDGATETVTRDIVGPGESLTLETNGASQLSFSMSGIWTGLVAVYASVDGIDYFNIPLFSWADFSKQTYSSDNNLYSAAIGGFKSVKIVQITLDTGISRINAWLSSGHNQDIVTSPLASSFNVNVEDISGTVSLPTGASTEAKQDTGNTSLASIDSKLTNPLPISGTVTANQGTPGIGAWPTLAAQAGTWNIVNVSGTVSLPTGASTAALQTQPGVDIGDVTINNTSGASAVNIQDGGNSITVDGTVAATQSGTWNIATVSTITNVVHVDDNAGSLTIDGTVTVNPLTNSSIVKAQLQDNAGTAITLGQKTMTSSVPVVIASDQSTILVNVVDETANTYSASITGLATATTATDIFTITGSGTKTVRILKVIISAIRTNSASSDILLIKRSAANTGGTSSAPTAVPYDSNNAAATATVLAYTANPSLGAAIGTIASRKMFINSVGSGVSQDLIYEFGNAQGQAIILRGTSQVLAINLNGTTITSPSFNITMEWSEQ